MRREVTSRLSIDIEEPTELALCLAVARQGAGVSESLEVLLDGSPIDVTEVEDAHGTRLHLVVADEGNLTVDYAATIDGRASPSAASQRDRARYLRPSRYCESDELAATALAEFSGLKGADLLNGVSSWVGTRLDYVSGSSLPTDGAVRTLLARNGVCRDYAHLCVALLRASGVPARLVSVYAPGLDPMDFHAVCEALVDHRWVVVDATALAPRETLVRIATGRDAADTAFMSTLTGHAELLEIEVSAVADELPDDDLTSQVQLG